MAKGQFNINGVIKDIAKVQFNFDGTIKEVVKIQANIGGVIRDLWSGSNIIDHSTPVQVINAAYDTSGNGGRKLVRLNNGHQYAAMRNSTTAWYIYRTTDNWATKELFKTVTVSVNDIALATNGTNIYVLISYSTSGAKFYSYNEAGTALVNGVNIDVSQTAMGLCSMAVDGTGGIHISTSSKNATYPNSFNIRYSKSTDGGATWDSITQITTTSDSTRNLLNPCTLIDSSNNPWIIFAYVGTSSSMRYTYFNGSSWTGTTAVRTAIDDNESYVKSNPCAIADHNGIIHAVWQRYGASHTSTYHIYYCQYTSSWATDIDVAVGEKPSIAHDQDDNIYIQYERSGTIYQKVSTDHGATFGAETTIATGTNVNTCEYDNFTQPLCIFDGGADVKFAGVFTA